MNNPCLVTIQRELKAYLDGQLSFLPRLRVRRHLSHCATCREDLSAMEQIRGELRAYVPKPLDPALRARILDAVANADAPSTPLTAAQASHPRRKPLFLLGAIATALVAWITLYPLLHGDMEHSIMAGTQPSRDESGASQLKAAAPSLPAPTVMAGGLAAPSLRENGKMANAQAPSPREQPQLKQEMEVDGHAAAAQALAPKTLAPVTRQARKRAMGADADGHASDGGASVNGTSSNTATATQTPRSPSIFLFDTSSNRFESRLSGAKKKAIGDFNVVGSLRKPVESMAGEPKFERQIHREATISVEVDNVEAKSETVARYARTAGGFVANNELNTGDDNLKTASLTLKVPVARFEMVVGQVARLGEVKAKNVTGEDLTEQISDQQQSEYVLSQDVNTTREELTHRLTKTGRQTRLDTLRELRTRIAQTQARLQLLRKRGALSTITLELTEKTRPAPPSAPKIGGFVGDINDTLHAAVRSMTEAARLPILTFVWILVYSPLWILLLLGYRYTVRL